VKVKAMKTVMKMMKMKRLMTESFGQRFVPPRTSTFSKLSRAQGAEQVPGETDEGDDEEGVGGNSPFLMRFLAALNR
jgi:hypothetical protein